MFNNKIKVRVDKSHLFTLGEKMYKESIEFIRELVNNAYDADAVNARILISDEKIQVQDDGAGMNEKGLEQFFTIGSEEKKIHGVSPRFGRKRVGQFGIGKFSALALANQFIVETVKKNYKYTVIFDRHSWKSDEDWNLPIKKEKTTALDCDGTKITLNNLIKKINVVEIEKYLRESVPLRAKKFAVYVNNKKISSKTIAGRIISVHIKTIYGLIEGEIIIALNVRDVDEPGIECRVKQVFIKRSLFDLDKKYNQGIGRIAGTINADFLPLISARSDFIIDSEEYKLFYKLIKIQLEKILAELKKQNETKNFEKINKELKEVMSQIKNALLCNPDFVPQGRAVSRLKKQGLKKIAIVSETFNSQENQKNIKTQEQENNKTENQEKEKTSEEKLLKPEIEVKPLVVKQIRLKKFGISCGIVSLGKDGPEALSQGNMIYINQDHSLYQKLYKKHDLLSLHLLRLISQEVVLMKKNKIFAVDAFLWQGKLLKDAICEK